MTLSCVNFNLQILYKNVAHPKLAAFVKTQSWVVESGEYLTFPQNQTELKGGVVHYLESIEEVKAFGSLPYLILGFCCLMSLDLLY